MGAFVPMNPLVQAARAQEEKRQQVAQLLKAGLHFAAPPPGMPHLGQAPFVPGVPSTPQAPQAPLPPLKSQSKLPMQPQVEGVHTEPESLTPETLQRQAEQYGAMARQLLGQPDPAQPTYQAPARQQMDPRQILIEGIGSLFQRGPAAEATMQGIGEQDKALEAQHEQDLQTADNQYNRQMAAYDRNVTARESRIQHLLTAQEDAGKEAATMQNNLARQAQVNEQIKLKALEINNRESDVSARLKERVWEMAQRVGIADKSTAEKYWAVSQQQAGALQRAGMRADTALNVAQLGAASRLMLGYVNGQNAYARTQLQQSGAWDRTQLIQQNESARGAMVQLNKLILEAGNPKNKNAQAAVAQLQHQMGDPSSALSLLMQQMQASGVMGEPIGDELRAEVEASVPQAGAGAPAFAPQAPVVNNYIGEPGAAPPAGPVSLGNVQDYIKQLGIGGNGGGAPAAAATAQHPHGAAQAQHEAAVPSADVEAARGWLQHYLQGKPMTPEAAQAAWHQFVTDPQTGAHTIPPHELEQIRAQLLGSGGPSQKNFPSLP